MNRFDKVKIISDLNAINDLNEKAFVKTIGKDTLYFKYKQDTPYNLIIIADKLKKEMSLEFTGKILKDDYPKLIGLDNIEDCLKSINDIGIVALNTEFLLCKSEVVKCDVTKDVVIEDFTKAISNVKRNITNHRRWVISHYQGEGLVINNTVKTPRHKLRVCIYPKGKEMNRSTNKGFLDSLQDKDALQKYFSNKTRIELNLNTMEQIRKYFMTDNNLVNILSSTQNPIYAVLSKAIGNADDTITSKDKMSLRDYERLCLIEKCDGNTEKIEELIRVYSGSCTSIKRAMAPYKRLLPIWKDESEAVQFSLLDLVA